MEALLAERYPGLKVETVVRGAPGLTAADSIAMVREELRRAPAQLVLWQTGAVEAARNLDLDELVSALDSGLARIHVAGADAVVNVAAAFRGVPDEEAWAVNRDAALELGRAAADSGVRRFVQVSTGLVYGTGRGRPLTEDDESRPGGSMWGAYPASKAEAERSLLALDGLDVRVARLPFVYGEGDPHLAQSLMWAKNWASAQRLQVGHHADVAQGLLRVLHAPGISGRIYNIADDAPVTAVELHQLNGVEIPGELYERVDPDPWLVIMSTERIRRELGYRSLYPSVYAAREAGAL